MTPENCGECGLKSIIEVYGDGETLKTVRCPVHNCKYSNLELWNAAQFAARTRRINAAAGLAWEQDPACSDQDLLLLAESHIAAQDAAARARWAALQGGE